MSDHADQASAASGLRQLVASLAVLALAVGAIAYFLLTGQTAPRDEEAPKAVLVDVFRVGASSPRPAIIAYGVIEPARRLPLSLQVGGRITQIHPALEPGGLIGNGETLVQIDKADYELALRQAKARLSEVEAQLEIEQGRQASARRELESFEEFEDAAEADADLDLILRGPQRRSAEAAIERARADVEQARLNLDRTTITAPFDSIVESERLEIGQLVQPGQRVAELQGVQTGHVIARVPVRYLPHLSVPGWNAETGSTGKARYRLGDVEIHRPIRIRNLAGNLEPEGRMARVLLALDDPLGRETPLAGGDAEGIWPLLYGAFVEVEIDLARSGSLIELPAGVMRARERLFVMTAEDTLDIRQPTVFLRSGDRVYVSDGLREGERVITSMIANPVEGMKLRRASADTQGSSKNSGGPTKSL